MNRKDWRYKMEGRKENEKKMILRIKEILKTSPRYIKEYYYTLND